MDESADSSAELASAALGADVPPTPPEPQQQSPRPRGALRETAAVVAIAIAAACAIQALIVKPYRIPSASMVPTLLKGDRVLVNRIGNRFTDPQVGDVVVFRPALTADESAAAAQCSKQVRDDQICETPAASSSKQTFVKRIVGGPGDRIAVRGGRVIRNGRRTGEPFISHSCDGGLGQKCTLEGSSAIRSEEHTSELQSPC